MKTIAFLFAATALCAASGAAVAANTNAPFVRPPHVASKAPSSLLLSYSPPTGMATISKNVASVTEVETGRFCVTPAHKIPAGSLPVVTVEYGYSIGANLLAFYELSAHDCAAATDIEVRTFDFTSGTATPADNIAFNVNVQ